MNTIFKKWVSALALASALMFTSTASNALIINTGTFEVTASIFIDASGTSSIGIGQVDVLRNNGLVTWTSGDGGEYLNFEFSNYTRINTASFPPVTLFEATGGLVNFWLTTDANAFRPDLDFLGATAAMQAGPASLYVSGQGNGSTFGTFTAQTYSANGFLDAIGGTEVTVFDTNSITTLSSALSDISFNVSADNIHASGVNTAWNYSGSADLNGKVQQPANVDEPNPGTLMLLGLCMLGISLKLRKQD